MAWNPVRGVRRLLREELARGASWNMVFTATVGVLSVLSGIVAARHLGPGGVGVLSIGFLIVEFASVLDNLPTSGFIREYSHNPTRTKVATVLVVKGAIGLALTIVLLAAAPFIAGVFEVPVHIPLVFALIPTGSIISSVAIMSHEARRDMPRRNAPIVVEHVTRLVLYSLVGLSLWLPVQGPLGIAIATLGGTIGGTIAGVVFIPRTHVSEWDPALARHYFVFGSKTAAAGTLQKIIFWFDIALIDVMLGHATQGLYRTAYTLMSNLPLVAGTVTTVLYPQVAHAFAEHRHEDMRRAVSLGFFYSLAIALPFALAFLLFPRFLLTTLMGPEFADAAWMLQALAGIGLVAVAFAPLDAFLPAANRPDLALKVSLAMMVANTTLDVILIPTLGVAGAIVATGFTFVLGLVLVAFMLKGLGVPFPRFADVVKVLRHD